MIDRKVAHEIIRGTFSGPELEHILWETSWIDWESHSGTEGVFDTKTLGLFDISPSLLKAVQQLGPLLPPGAKRFAWLERHKEGDWHKLHNSKLTQGHLLILSIAQFRGGRTHLGTFHGYINPGEILSIQLTGETTSYHVEKVSSGERIVLCLAQKN